MIKERIILDTDPGIDDALALLLLAASPEIKIEAITTTHGNSTVENCTNNALQLLELAKLDIPVARGAAEPLIKDLTIAAETHGDNGLGNAHLPATQKSALTQHASDLICEIINANPGEITILAIGPLTNIALAIHRSPQIVNKVKRIITMAGAIHFPGNASPDSEYNVFCDPEAFDIVLRSKIPLTVVPLDVTYKCLFTTEHLKKISTRNVKIKEFIEKATAFYMDFHHEYQNIQGCAVNDPLAAALLIKPDLVELFNYFMTVELNGKYTRAKTSVDYFQIYKESPNVQVAMRVDVEEFMNFFIERINRL